MQPATYAAGVRRPFRDLPPEVVAWVTAQLGEDVTEARDAQGGFSPGVAAVVRGASGSSMFVKAVGAAVNPDSLPFYRREWEVSARLPRLDGIVLPSAGTELDVAGEQYVVLAFPALDGEPPAHPWRPAPLAEALDALHALSLQLTPSPWRNGGAAPRLPEFFHSWDQIAADSDDPWRALKWVRGRSQDLVAAEAQLREEVLGDTLSHTDLRADNLVLTPGRVWFVDWAHAENAARWVDGGLLLADVVASRADGGDGGEVDVRAVFASHPLFAGVRFEALWRLVVSLAGALHTFSRRPSPPGLPTIRPWQHNTAETILAWAAREAPADWTRPQPSRTATDLGRLFGRC